MNTYNRKWGLKIEIMEIKSYTIFIYSIIIITLICLAILLINGKTTNSSSKNVYEKLEAKETIQYLVIGDSIGRGSGASKNEYKWFQLLEKHIKDTYGSKMKRSLVVQSGSTAFEGLYKFKQDKVRKADLVFIVFGENDRKYMSPEKFSDSYTQLLQEVATRFPKSEIITVTENSLDEKTYADVITKVTQNYQATNFDMRVPFSESQLTVSELTTDTVHPNDIGNRLFAKEVFTLIKKNIDSNKIVDITPKNQKEFSNWNMYTKSDYANVDSSFSKRGGFYTTEKIGASIKYEFNGTYLGANMFVSEQGGLIDVYIDGQYVRTISSWWPIAKKRALYIASNLSDGSHSVTFQLAGEESGNELAITKKLEISSVIVDN